MSDLRVLSAAMELAIENVKMDFDGNRNSAAHDADYKQWERAIRESLRTYQKCAKDLAEMTKLKRR
jgi:uncharacterized protein YukE